VTRLEAPTGVLSEHIFRFPSDAQAAAAARRAVRDVGSALPAHFVADLELCVTELVTNGVQHPDTADGEMVEMSVQLSDDAVRVEVGDRGDGFDPDRTPREGGPGGGFGLYIVGLLADRWGVERLDLAWVWFEIDLGGPGARE
jgi:anti-sigma regulatory factor (Ser/Thr protein kinase)